MIKEKKKQKERLKKHEYNTSSLPASVLQTGAIFLSIIIEALPLFDWSSISGFEVYVTPEKGLSLLAKINGLSFLWKLDRYCLSILCRCSPY